MTRLTQTPFAITFIVFFACVGASLARTQATDTGPATPDFRVQIWGELAADFSARIESYLELRRRLEKGLPPLMVTDDPADIVRAERALAGRIRVARAGVTFPGTASRPARHESEYHPGPASVRHPVHRLRA